MLPPQLGDVIFSKADSLSSFTVRAIDSLYSGELSQFSHAAMTIDCNTLVHAEKASGVDIAYLRDFFARPSLAFQALRPPDALTMATEEATYFIGQKYDSNFIKRFLRAAPQASAQVCSTLVAELLVEFSGLTISESSKMSPNLLRAHLLQLEWRDVTKDYSRWLSVQLADADIYALFRLHRDNVLHIQSSSRSERCVSASLRKILDHQLRIAEQHNLQDCIAEIRASLADLDKLQASIFKFHDVS